MHLPSSFLYLAEIVLISTSYGNAVRVVVESDAESNQSRGIPGDLLAVKLRTLTGVLQDTAAVTEDTEDEDDDEDTDTDTGEDEDDDEDTGPVNFTQTRSVQLPWEARMLKQGSDSLLYRESSDLNNGTRFRQFSSEWMEMDEHALRLKLIAREDLKQWSISFDIVLHADVLDVEDRGMQELKEMYTVTSRTIASSTVFDAPCSDTIRWTLESKLESTDIRNAIQLDCIHATPESKIPHGEYEIVRKRLLVRKTMAAHADWVDTRLKTGDSVKVVQVVEHEDDIVTRAEIDEPFRGWIALKNRRTDTWFAKQKVESAELALATVAELEEEEEEEDTKDKSNQYNATRKSEWKSIMRNVGKNWNKLCQGSVSTLYGVDTWTDLYTFQSSTSADSKLYGFAGGDIHGSSFHIGVICAAKGYGGRLINELQQHRQTPIALEALGYVVPFYYYIGFRFQSCGESAQQPSNITKRANELFEKGIERLSADRLDEELEKKRDPEHPLIGLLKDVCRTFERPGYCKRTKSMKTECKKRKVKRTYCAAYMQNQNGFEMERCAAPDP